MALSAGRAALVVAAAVTAAVAPARAETDRQLQLWDALSITGDLAPDQRGLAVWFDGHLRRGDTGAVTIIRPGLGYRLSKAWSVWAGYGWIPTFSEGGDRRDEHRGWQQAIGSTKLGPVSVSSRTRFEQRLGEGGDDVGLRLRQWVRASWTPTGSPVGLVVWDELFVALGDTDWGQAAGFDQNRAFAGVALPVGDSGRLEVGYLFANVDRAVDVHIHALATSLSFALAR
ncbi:MAG: DUF2490 domain-containing protein [Kofleriaceae bacterium]